ncbi:MAG: hypothetical protein Q9183_003593, partial [Haloplaca sp. 2 TL-2023]
PFDSEIFVLVVGTQKKRFRAHSAYLGQSPVFDAMCRHSFTESKTHQIDLPEDDPHVFSLILKYLYAGNFAGYDGLLDDDSLDIDRDTRALQLADVFLLAEKYQLSDLKELLVSKLATFADVHENIPAFLETARKVYSGIPETETVYRHFFQMAVTGMLPVCKMDGPAREAFNKTVSDGGILATDLVAGMCSVYNFELRESQESLGKGIFTQ